MSTQKSLVRRDDHHRTALSPGSNLQENNWEARTGRSGRSKIIQVYFGSEMWTVWWERGFVRMGCLNCVLTCQSHWVSGPPLGRQSVDCVWLLNTQKDNLGYILKIKCHTSSHDLQSEGHPKCEAFAGGAVSLLAKFMSWNIVDNQVEVLEQLSHSPHRGLKTHYMGLTFFAAWAWQHHA